MTNADAVVASLHGFAVGDEIVLPGNVKGTIVRIQMPEPAIKIRYASPQLYEGQSGWFHTEDLRLD